MAIPREAKPNRPVETHEEIEQNWDLVGFSKGANVPITRPNLRKRALKKTTSEEERVKILSTYLLTGCPRKTAKALGYTQTQIFSMRSNADWWENGLALAKRKKNDELDAVFTDTIHKSTAAITDRLENGEYVRDARTGEIVRVPVKVRDLVAIAKTNFDSRALLRGDATTISAKRQNPLDMIEKKMEEWSKKLQADQLEKVISTQSVKEKIKDASNP